MKTTKFDKECEHRKRKRLLLCIRIPSRAVQPLERGSDHYYAMEPEDLTVIGHTDDLLADIYTAKYGAYLHFTVLLNDGGKGAQSRRNGCSI